MKNETFVSASGRRSQPTDLDSLLFAIAETLDVPPSAYTQATERYEAVGNWLLAEGSSLRASDPVVYPQGSFAIGTVVRPLLGDDYDLDAVVQLADPRQLWTPATLKSSVGERLQEHATYRRLLQGEGRRCWTLNYSAVDARHGFHLDLLPSVPSATQPSQTGRPDQSVTPNASVTAIAITNRVSPLKVEWCESDPKGYAAWFERRMIPLTERNDMFAGDRLAGVEAVRQVTSRTPLQYVIQLLKRHRDVLFLGKGEHAPISIIITTLAAMAYEGEDTIEGALLGVVSRLGRGIEQRAGEIFIRNPVRPTENFADRWRGDPKKVTAFTSWVQATRDFASRLQAGTSAALQGELEKALGESSAKEAMAKFAARRTRGDSAVFLHQPASLTETSGVFLRGVTGALARVQRLLSMSPHREAPRWPLGWDGTELSLRGRMVDSRGAFVGAIRSGDSVDVGTNLRFEVVADEIGEAEIFWQVVNTGVEAERAGDLRGKLFRDTSVRKEVARYRGEHFVEAFLVRQGVCVARSGEFVVQIR